MNRSEAEKLVPEYESKTIMPLGTSLYLQLGTFINWLYNQGYEVIKGNEYEKHQEFQQELNRRRIKWMKENEPKNKYPQ